MGHGSGPTEPIHGESPPAIVANHSACAALECVGSAAVRTSCHCWQWVSVMGRRRDVNGLDWDHVLVRPGGDQAGEEQHQDGGHVAEGDCRLVEAIPHPEVSIYLSSLSASGVSVHCNCSQANDCKRAKVNIIWMGEVTLRFFQGHNPSKERMAEVSSGLSTTAMGG